MNRLFGVGLHRVTLEMIGFEGLTMGGKDGRRWWTEVDRQQVD